MLRKIILVCLFSVFSFSAQALEFIGQDINKMNKSELYNFLVSKGAKPSTEDTLTQTYNLENSQIPLAIWAKAYYNHDNEFVGLQIGFPYDQYDHLSIRKTLQEKYGKPVSKSSFPTSFLSDVFFENVIFKFKDGTSIEYNSDNFLKVNYRKNETKMYIFYRNDVKKNKLIQKLKDNKYNSEKEKLKNVF